ncbi:MAG: hypothetical protein PVF67_07220, partial [Anaerolineae bacterium]
GPEELLQQLAHTAMSQAQVTVETNVHGEGALPDKVRIALYRITQEALNNVTKHAEAAHAIVELDLEPEQDGEPTLAQQVARQVLEFAQENTQSLTGSCMQFDGLHENRSHFMAEIDAESSRSASQSLGVEPPAECRPVPHAATGPLSEESMGSGD